MMGNAASSAVEAASTVFASLVGNPDDVGDLQRAARALLFLQVFFSMLGGSLAPQYGSILVATLAVSLFALMAMENGAPRLQRVYAIMLPFLLFLDIIWFFVWGSAIRHLEVKDVHQTASTAKLALAMQCLVFVAQVLSAAVWYKMWQLGLGAAADGGYASIGEAEAPPLRFGGYGTGGYNATGFPPPAQGGGFGSVAAGTAATSGTSTSQPTPKPPQPPTSGGYQSFG
eukprot:jgi/Chlat1/5317/Chrsp35S05255